VAKRELTKRHNFAQAERFILSREFFGMKLGLENVSGFLTDIGSPQTRYPSVHISGTNGKGSCAAMLASILTAAGYRTGLFTSPHLSSLRERARVDGRDIPKRSVSAFVDRHRRELTRRKLSFFEVVTAMALEHFARQSVDIAVVEVGLGGRLDATNVLRPVLTMTTDVSFDHVEFLGNTLGQIAWEKAGIVKPGVPHLIGLMPGKAEVMQSRVCAERGAPMYRLTPDDFRCGHKPDRFDFVENGCRVEGLRPSLVGRHQMTNAALTVKAATLLRSAGFKVSKKAVREGLKRTHWPGRFQIIRRDDSPTIVLDVGHNEKGMRSFAETFSSMFHNRRARVITGFVKRKQHQKMIDSLAEIAEDFHLVPLATHRSTDIRHLTDTLDFRGRPVQRRGSLTSAWRKVLSESGPDDIIAIVGSHYLVGEFLQKHEHS
jgi:dihydrofolate synthase/folylpolyglutamate synthase